MTRANTRRLGTSIAIAILGTLGWVVGCSDNPTDPGEPPPPPTGSFRSLAAGSYHTCDLTPSGAAYCWGSGGLLGDGSTQDSPAPVAVVGGLTFSALSAGQSHTCGLTADGAAYCWGENLDGQLGTGTTTPSRRPVAAAGGLRFSAVVAGGSHTCGITTGGAAYCWGSNFFGPLGDGSTIANRLVPTAVAGGLTFSVLAAGEAHTCALATGGAAYCWGVNLQGQLGTGASGPAFCPVGGGSCSTRPVAVTGGHTFASLSARVGHTCGLTTAGIAYCWGSNYAGQLGTGSTTGPEVCPEGGSDVPCSRRPVAVTGGRTFSSLTAGGYHTCGVTASGAAYCWGSSSSGQLGIGLIEPELCKDFNPCSATPLAVIGGLTWSAASAGGGHTCAMATDAVAYCWGSNRHGQLGIGTTNGPEQCPSWRTDSPCSLSPVKVAGQP